MNKIVREHYPASKLPADLRDAIGAAEQVTITIVTEEEAKTSATKDDWFSKYEHLRRGHFRSIEEINEHVRSLRDE
jgi:hypothetical protein